MLDHELDARVTAAMRGDLCMTAPSTTHADQGNRLGPAAPMRARQLSDAVPTSRLVINTATAPWMCCAGVRQRTNRQRGATTVSSLHQGFQEKGQPDGTEAVFRWLDGADESPLIQQVKQRMLDACPVGEGDQVLDVGCGLGHEVRRLAQRVGPQGRVVGIDANPAMITEGGCPEFRRTSVAAPVIIMPLCGPHSGLRR